MENMKFKVYNKDTLLAEVEIIDNKVKVERYILNSALQPFFSDTLNVGHILSFFESRCFDKNRGDKAILLEKYGLTEYNPIEIVKKSKGRLWEDFTWVDFYPYTDTKWKDISDGRG